MGTEVASRLPLTPGNLTSGSGAPTLGHRRGNSSLSSLSSSGSTQTIYSREYHLRIQARKYGLSSAFVCFGAKIHHRYHTQDSRQGLSRVRLEEHPTRSLEIVEQPSLPQEFSHKVAQAISSYQETPASSNRSSPTVTEEIPSHGDLFATGNTTERSSVDSNYSWDEFDRQAAKKVQHLFDEIDSVLFEKQSNQAEYIKTECQEWGSQFPHLRILGRQLMPPKDSGFEIIERDMSRPSTTSSMGLLDITEQDYSGSTDSQGLSISGKKVWAIIPPVEARSRNSGTPSTQSSEYSHLEEEIFEKEGEYEEIIAVDYKDIYEDSHHKKQLTPRRRRPHYPPITPNACLKDGAASSAFDCMWQEIISWIRPIMKRYSAVVNDEKPSLTLSQVLPQQLRNESTPGPPSRENSMFRFAPPTRAHTIMGPVESRTLESPKLDGVLTISRKKVMQRESSTLVDPTESQLTITRPASSFVVSHKRPPSVRIGTKGGRAIPSRLAPLPSADRSKTPSVQDEERVPAMTSSALLVKKLNPPGALGRLSSPLYNARNGALPPIGTLTALELESHPRYQKKMTASRASSAVDKDLRVYNRDRYITAQDTRPSTTHAMRDMPGSSSSCWQSETPVGMTRRASTPFGSAFNNNTISRNPSFGPGGMVLGITGSGLQPTSEMGHLGNIPQESLEDHEGLDDHIHPNQWTPSTPSHNPYKRGRQMSSLVRS